jgi:cytochrome c biogenesis protein CcmG/thiol:disulfide interchange protein DsbE
MKAGERMRRTVVLVVLGVAVVLVIVVAAFVPLGRTEPERVVVGGSPLYGKPAPPIDLPTIDGQRVRLSDLAGRPVLVNFWASWCIPCRDEFPQLVDAYARHRADGLEILGIVHDDSLDGARAFAAGYGATWPLLDDAQDAAWEDYLGIGVPQSYFIDRDGVVRAFSLGPFTADGLAAQLATILPTGPEASGDAKVPSGSVLPG